MLIVQIKHFQMRAPPSPDKTDVIEMGYFSMQNRFTGKSDKYVAAQNGKEKKGKTMSQS